MIEKLRNYVTYFFLDSLLSPVYMERIFIGVKIRSPEASIISQLYQPYLTIPGVNWVEADNLHITLRFIGEVAYEKRINIAKALERIEIPKFTVKLAGVGSFPNKGPPRVIHLGLKESCPELTRIKQKVDEALNSIEIPFEEEDRFNPHITLARVKRVKGPELKGFMKTNGNFEGPYYDICGFHLLRSTLTTTGAVYEVLQEYEFKG